MAEVLKPARRIVVKVGSSLVTNEGRGVDAEAIGNWCVRWSWCPAAPSLKA
jgi:glutamate 5-kinase